jgi:hypothetical protein
MMDEEQIQGIAERMSSAGGFVRNVKYSEMEELIAEVRRLRDQNKALDPYGRGVVTKSTEF